MDAYSLKNTFGFCENIKCDNPKNQKLNLLVYQNGNNAYICDKCLNESKKNFGILLDYGVEQKWPQQQ